jgi:hypothetical protein
VAAVGSTLYVPAGLVRVISSRSSAHVRHVLNGQDRVALCQLDGARWATFEGRAVIRDEPAAVADAEQRYAPRYRQPRPHPTRVVIEVTIARVLGSSGFR